MGVGGFEETEVLRLAAGRDQVSENPLAEAIVAEARRRGLGLVTPEGFESSTGIGVRGTVAGRRVAIGNTELMHELGVDPAPLLEQAESQRREGARVMFLAVDGVAAGLLAVTDPIKASTQEAIDELHPTGLRIVQATGDGEATAIAVARRLGIHAVHVEVRPQDTLDLV